MKKIIGLGLSVLMTAAALAGCGGNGGAATSTAGDSSANAATTKNDSISGLPGRRLRHPRRIH